MEKSLHTLHVLLLMKLITDGQQASYELLTSDAKHCHKDRNCIPSVLALATTKPVTFVTASGAGRNRFVNTCFKEDLIGVEHSSLPHDTI